MFTEVVKGYLKRIVFGADGFATALPLPGFEHADLVADVRRSFGQPSSIAASVGCESPCSSEEPAGHS